ncbi:hypothetical protein LWI28_000405 [Acer negundo]|uniref:Uncharacterized protein n=1 Tax=Acer negundo TaxID=4023 RepID=A0AAD5JBQ1_ACENE|nr:hypothetical protein LWI28_000405 [Acer negundo]
MLVKDVEWRGQCMEPEVYVYHHENKSPLGGPLVYRLKDLLVVRVELSSGWLEVLVIVGFGDDCVQIGTTERHLCFWHRKQDMRIKVAQLVSNMMLGNFR